MQGSDAPFQSLSPLPIVDDNGVFMLNQSSLPSINDHGLAAFFAVDQTGNEGIYLTSEPGTFERVVQAGNALAGSTVVRLVLSPEGINNFGELAFFAELADGREIIVTATSVPEPSTSYLLLLFGAMAIRYRSRHVLS